MLHILYPSQFKLFDKLFATLFVKLFVKPDDQKADVDKLRRYCRTSVVEHVLSRNRFMLHRGVDSSPRSLVNSDLEKLFWARSRKGCRLNYM